MEKEKLVRANQLNEHINRLEKDRDSLLLLLNDKFLERTLYVKFNGGEFGIPKQYCKELAKDFLSILQYELDKKVKEFNDL